MGIKTTKQEQWSETAADTECELVLNCIQTQPKLPCRESAALFALPFIGCLQTPKISWSDIQTVTLSWLQMGFHWLIC